MNIKELYKIFLSSPFICTDTRSIKKGSMFFALKGENFNGNKYASQAIEKGSNYAIVDEKEYATSDSIILVNDVLHTLQKLANYHRLQLDIPIIAITGTNGKTTTKELVNAVLSGKYKVLATAGNFNNHIGVPLTLLLMNDKTEIGIVEMGANHPREIKTLCEIAEPNYGLITNIGKAHLEGFGSFEGVINTKKELYDYIEISKGEIFINNDNELLMSLIKSQKLTSYGITPKANCIAEKIDNSLFVGIKDIESNISINTNLVGGYNFENILASVCIGKYFNIDIKDVKKSIEAYNPDNNRSQIKKTENNTLILDAYNANPTSMSAAISNFGNIENKVPTPGIFVSDLDLLKSVNLNDALLVGKEFCECLTNDEFRCFKNYYELNIYIKDNPINDALILIKGSRGIKLEKVIENL